MTTGSSRCVTSTSGSRSPVLVDTSAAVAFLVQDHAHHDSTFAALADRQLGAVISTRGTPLQVDQRWVVERTHAWLNDFGRIRRCTERRRACVDAYLALAAAIVTVRALRRAAWYLYRLDTRQRSPRIR